MLRSFFIFCFICFITNNSVAQTQGYEYSDSTLLDNPEEGIPTNPNKEEANFTDTILYMHEIMMPADTVDSWKNDKKYAYVKNLDSLLKEREKEYLSQNRTVSSDSSSSASSGLSDFFSSSIVKGIFWAMAIFFVLYILYKLFLNQGIFKKNRSSIPVKEVAQDEHLIDNASDYDALIRQSFNIGDYRMAVRYLFLKTLRQLSDKGQLQRSVDKTNFQYVQEIGPDKKNDFASLVLNYEYVWYGHLNIAREQYEQIEKNYHSFYNKI
ncbi:MAG: DUF4129 domain-containing protein [Ferruginibacter sp.]